MEGGTIGETNSKLDKIKALKCTETNASDTLSQAPEISGSGDGAQNVVEQENDAKASADATEATGSETETCGQQASPVAVHDNEMHIDESTIKIKEAERDNQTQGVPNEIPKNNAERSKNLAAESNMRGPGLGRGLLVSGNGAVPNGNYNYRLNWFKGFSSEAQTRVNRSQRIIRTQATELNGRPVTQVTKMTIVQRKMTVPRLVKKVEQLTSLYGEDHHLVITYESYLNRLRGSTYPVAYIHTDTLISHSYEPM